MVKGAEIGGFGGGQPEHPRQWLGAQLGWPLPGSTELPGATRRAPRRHRSRAGALPRVQVGHAAEQHVLERERRDLFSGAVDDLLESPDELQVAIGVEEALVAWLGLGLGLGLGSA